MESASQVANKPDFSEIIEKQYANGVRHLYGVDAEGRKTHISYDAIASRHGYETGQSADVADRVSEVGEVDDTRKAESSKLQQAREQASQLVKQPAIVKRWARAKQPNDTSEKNSALDSVQMIALGGPSRVNKWRAARREQKREAGNDTGEQLQKGNFLSDLLKPHESQVEHRPQHRRNVWDRACRRLLVAGYGVSSLVEHRNHTKQMAGYGESQVRRENYAWFAAIGIVAVAVAMRDVQPFLSGIGFGGGGHGGGSTDNPFKHFLDNVHGGHGGKQALGAESSGITAGHVGTESSIPKTITLHQGDTVWDRSNQLLGGHASNASIDRVSDATLHLNHETESQAPHFQVGHRERVPIEVVQQELDKIAKAKQ